MATIVQPYNPWREQLALTALGNVAGNIISDLWKNHNQNEQNRKVNAFRGQLNQDLNNSSQNNAVSLTAMGAPDGYNSNPWANAFHKTDSPLTQFDIGTAGIGKTPSIQDIMRGVDSLAATSRFSMINPETIGKIRNDLLQGAYAEMFRNVGNDIQGQMNALTMGAANGVVAPQILTAFGPWAMHNTPHYTFSDVDLGSHKVTVARNPKDGTASPVMISPVALSPYQKGMLDVQRYGIDTNASMNRERNDIARTELEYTRDQNLWNRGNPPLSTFTDAEGNVWNRNPTTGEFTPAIGDDGLQIIGDTGKNPALTAAINAIDSEMKTLDSQAKEIRDMYKTRLIVADDDERKTIEAEMNQKLAPITARQEELSTLREQYVEQLFPKNRQRRKPAQTTPTTTQPTQTNVQPTVKTVSGSVPQVIVTAMGATSPDVRQPETPQLPATPTTPPANPTTQNTSVNPIQGNLFRIVPRLTALSPDNTPTPTPQPKQPEKKVQPRPVQNNMRDFDIPDDMAYDPVRDKNIEQSNIYTHEHFRKFIKDMQDDPRFATWSTEKMIDYAYRIGIRIKQEQ